MSSLRTALLSIFLLALTGGVPLAAQSLPCSPCAGVRVDAEVANEALRALAGSLPAASDEPATLVLAWEAPLDGSGAFPEAGDAPAAGRVTRWVTLPFRTPPPLAQQAVRLQGELEAVSRLAAAAPVGTFFQIVWRPEGAAPGAPLDMAEYAFLLKRAAVAQDVLAGFRTDERGLRSPPLSGRVAATIHGS